MRVIWEGRNSIAVAGACKGLELHGPDRVYIWVNGGWEGVRTEVAAGLGDEIEVVFIRADGWTLGASRANAKEAFAVYADRWVAFTPFPALDPRPIQEWKP